MILNYFLIVGLILAVWFAFLKVWSRRVDADIEEGARVEWDLLSRKEPDLLKGLDEASFAAFFRRVEHPRGPIHVFGAVAAFLIGAPFILAITALTIGFMERTDIIPQPAEQAQQLKMTSDGIQLIARADLTTLQYILQGWGGFFTFFSLLIFWVIVFWVTFTRFHGNRPGSLREEILRAR